MNPHIYLDANATSPVLPAAIDAALDAMRDCFGNPSSSHACGLRARALLDAARARARRVVGAGAGRLMFTSGATEGIQTAVLSALCALRERQAAGQPCGDLLLYGATEHKAVPESLVHWNRLLGTNLALRALPVDGDGRHRLDVLRELAPRAALVCTMAANNETGAVSDLAGIEAVLRETGSGALWMVDCVQALGKLALDLAATRIDYAPFSGHKLYAPKGIGMLYVREGAPFTPLMAGGGQEAGQRSGTENMAGIAAFGAVLQALEQGGTFRTHAQLVVCRNRLALALREAFPRIVFNVPFEHALPTTLNFSVPGLCSKELLDLFDAAGVRVSAGSACSAAKAAPSYVLEAMQLPAWRSAAAVRMSFGPLVDDAFIDAACAAIRRCGEALRAERLELSPLARGATGVLQLAGDGATGWLLFDPALRRCVAIDPPAAQAVRVAALVRRQGYRMRAILGTGAASAQGRAALAAELGELLDQAGDSLGWPAGGDIAYLADGTAARFFHLGGEVVAQRSHQRGERAGYLLGTIVGEQLPAPAVRLAFSGQHLPAAAAAELAGLAAPGTVLCFAADGAALPYAAPAGPVHAGGAGSGGGEGEGGSAGGAIHLDAPALERLLDAHPDALLIDVREAAEHAAGAAQVLGRSAHCVPLSRLAEHLPHWLGAGEQPLVFLCRSGSRSTKAAQCLRSLGYAQAWDLAGGLALAG
jgi:cysteine sulfinate desulfinase/cysteine desulfurase-like protein/rhodanese-related sulfurtransferase